MDVTAVCERVRGIALAASSSAGGIATDELSPALRAVTEVRAWLDAREATLVAATTATASFPEQTVAECTRTSLRAAQRLTERAASLGRLPRLAGALAAGVVTAGHVDAVTVTARRLDPERRAELLERADALSEVAAAATVPEFRRRLTALARSLERDDGTDRLERQRRATTLRTWIDHDGMWCLEGRYDPLTGLRLAARLDAAVQTLYAETTPDTAPADPLLKQRHLQAIAFARLVGGDAGGVTTGRPEIVIVVHVDDDDEAPELDARGAPTIDWGLPVEIPARVLADLAGDADVHAVVVRNGVVLHAPGRLDLGRTTRLANRAQRRALRALYPTCSIPGCDTHFDHCKIHHVVWWRHGGRTDLANLVPLCSTHHAAVHDRDWHLTLDPNRLLTLTLPDGTIHNTGPPGRRAA